MIGRKFADSIKIEADRHEKESGPGRRMSV
jgi:hypothetical protein